MKRGLESRRRKTGRIMTKAWSARRWRGPVDSLSGLEAVAAKEHDGAEHGARRRDRIAHDLLPSPHSRIHQRSRTRVCGKQCAAWCWDERGRGGGRG